MTRLYEREIKDFFEVAKIKMAGTAKEGKGNKFGKTLSVFLNVGCVCVCDCFFSFLCVAL